MIKVVAFDFDNTLYNGYVFKNYREYLKEILTKYFKNEDKAENFLIDCFKEDNHYTNKAVSLRLQELGYSAKRFVKLLGKHIYKHACIPEIISTEFLKELAKKYHLYIATMSTSQYLKHYMKKFNIDRRLFKKCYSVDLSAKNISKKDIYYKLLKREKISKDELLMIGDNPVEDIETAKEVGIKYLYYNKENFNQIYNYFKNL